jgi:flagellar biosynthetic protein FlhB
VSAQDDGQERQHQASERRKKQFRERGEIARSREVTSAVGLIATTVALVVAVEPMVEAINMQFQTHWTFSGSPDMDLADAISMAGGVVRDLAWLLGLPLGIIWIITLIGGVAQSQAVIPKEPLKIKWETLDIASSFQQKFLSSQPWVELAKGVSKLFVLGLLAWLAIRDRMPALPALAATTPEDVFQTMGEFLMVLVMRAIPVAIVVAAGDYAYQWWRLSERMKMTTQELKDEYKESEGDPHMKAARKARARQIAMAQTLQNVKKADLVLTNPTHFAVALSYDTREAPAPVVVAKGIDHLALRIRQEAGKHDIPCIENRPLARALYAQAEEGQMIPEDYYGPVAKVLAKVLKRKRKRVVRDADERSPPSSQ